MSEEPDPNPNEATHVAFYNAARAELVARIGLRDSALLAYITGIGGYFGFVLGRSDSPLFGTEAVTSGDVWREMLLLTPLPFVCATFTMVILQHHMIIGTIQHYLSLELFPKARPRDYDGSRTLLTGAGHFQNLRTAAQAMALCFPLTYTLAYHVWYFFFSGARTLETDIASFVLAAIEAVVFILVVWLHLQAHRQRGKNWRERKEALEKGEADAISPARRFASAAISLLGLMSRSRRR